ncbi:hypothetical protein GE21DRAFT_1170555, partial [Neurospora crassa]
CRALKYPKDKILGKLYSIPVRNGRIVVDFKFIPTNRNRYNNILVIVDRFFK